MGQPSSQYPPNYPSQVGPTSAGIQRLSHPTITADPRGAVCCPPPPPNQSVISRTPPTCGAGRYSLYFSMLHFVSTNEGM